MMNVLSVSATLSDAELLREVRRLVGEERQATARLIAALTELDARRLYLGEGCSSLFTYCTRVLYLSEHAAYGRIEAARAARKWPAILDLLASRSLHLTAVSLLAPHLTAENHERLLAAACHKSKRDIEEMVAALRPQSPVPPSVRKLPGPKVASTERTPPQAAVPATRLASESDSARPPAESPKQRAEIKPLAPEHYKVQFTVSRETFERLRQTQDLLRHRIPNGDVGAIFERALKLLLSELQKTKCAATARPRDSSPSTSRGRYISAAVKREVWQRDAGQCAFVGTNGRCSERGFLEYHHVVAFADDGATTVDNLELRCRAHNAYEAERWFGVREEDVVRERGRV